MKSTMSSIDSFICNKTQSNDDEKLIVHLAATKVSLKGYIMPQIGHPVFEKNDRYLVYLLAENGTNPTVITFYKKELEPYIKFNKVYQ